MEDTVQPLLEEFGAHAYFCGHDHNLQHLHHAQNPSENKQPTLSICCLPVYHFLTSLISSCLLDVHCIIHAYMFEVCLYL